MFCLCFGGYYWFFQMISYPTDLLIFLNYFYFKKNEKLPCAYAIHMALFIYVYFHRFYSASLLVVRVIILFNSKWQLCIQLYPTRILEINTSFVLNIYYHSYINKVQQWSYVLREFKYQIQFKNHNLYKLEQGVVQLHFQRKRDWCAIPEYDSME